MVAQDTESQLKFLLSCVKNSTAGKVNFIAVADELGIVSKAAAAKRYERLLKAHDSTPVAGPKAAKGDIAPKPKRKPPVPRKRKNAEISADEEADDDEEEVKAEVKQEHVDKKPRIKKEATSTVSALSDGSWNLRDIPQWTRSDPRHHALASNQDSTSVDDDDFTEDETCIIVGDMLSETASDYSPSSVLSSSCSSTSSSTSSSAASSPSQLPSSYTFPTFINTSNANGSRGATTTSPGPSRARKYIYGLRANPVASKQKSPSKSDGAPFGTAGRYRTLSAASTSAEPSSSAQGSSSVGSTVSDAVPPLINSSYHQCQKDRNGVFTFSSSSSA
ncbi:hypothetical protein B0H63DRAFT_447913 [Podospora didyma]|uniref:Myb-like DNA-binding domain-containing protein n=1 Tax=Podospora didyma TaxID=330526 RepID=A0AAE0NSS2_9PEZI|nr:hypothetical protein B0H63DRAFT_447913 [Podospora didyma]